MTDRQKEVFAVIKARQRRVLAGPTLREVAHALGIRPFAVQRHVASLRRLGMLEKEDGFGLVACDETIKDA